MQNTNHTSTTCKLILKGIYNGIDKADYLVLETANAYAKAKAILLNPDTRLGRFTAPPARPVFNLTDRICNAAWNTYHGASDPIWELAAYRACPITYAPESNTPDQQGP